MVVSADETTTKKTKKTELFVCRCNDAAHTGLPSPDDCLKSEQQNVEDAAFKERNAKRHDVILHFSCPRRNYKAFPQLQHNTSRGRKKAVNYMLE